MLRYMSVIRGMAQRNPGLGWKCYDQHFRKARENSRARWHHVDWLLIWEFGGVSSSTPYPTGQSHSQPFRGNHTRSNGGRSSQSGSRNTRSEHEGIPPGYCFPYHQTGECKQATRCKYKHACPKCRDGKRHPLCSCRGNGGQSSRPKGAATTPAPAIAGTSKAT